MAPDALIREFLERQGRRVLLLDSNLLLLLLATRLGPASFGHFKRVDFSFDDGILLIAIASQFRTVLATPAVLTETSNLGVTSRWPSGGC